MSPPTAPIREDQDPTPIMIARHAGQAHHSAMAVGVQCGVSGEQLLVVELPDAAPPVELTLEVAGPDGREVFSLVEAEADAGGAPYLVVRDADALRVWARR